MQIKLHAELPQKLAITISKCEINFAQVLMRSPVTRLNLLFKSDR